MGFVNDMDQIGRMTANTKLIKHLDRLEAQHRAEHPELYAAENAKAERRRAKLDTRLTAAAARESAAEARKAAADTRRDEAMATPLSPAMHRAMIVLAVLCALSVVGLPITGLIAYMLHAKGKAHTARLDTQRADAATEAERYLTAEDRDWMRRQGGQV